MMGLELVAGYLFAWGVGKLKFPGTRLNGEAGKVTGIDLRVASGVRGGNCSSQTGTFG